MAIACGELSLAEIRGAYGESEPGAALALFGSTGLLELAVNAGSAAERFGIERGDEITLTVGMEDVLA